MEEEIKRENVLETARKGTDEYYEMIDDKFKYDREFVIRAVAKDKEALEWACEEFQKDDTILTEAMLYAAKEKERLEEKEKKLESYTFHTKNK